MFRSYAAWKKVFVNKGTRTEWSPIPSVTIPMIDKIGRPRSESLICQSLVLLQIELDDMNSWYTFPKRKKMLIRRNTRQQRAPITRSVHLHRHDLVTVLLTVLLRSPIISMTRTLTY